MKRLFKVRTETDKGGCIMALMDPNLIAYVLNEDESKKFISVYFSGSPYSIRVHKDDLRYALLNSYIDVCTASTVK